MLLARCLLSRHTLIKSFAPTNLIFGQTNLAHLDESYEYSAWKGSMFSRMANKLSLVHLSDNHTDPLRIFDANREQVEMLIDKSHHFGFRVWPHSHARMHACKTCYRDWKADTKITGQIIRVDKLMMI